MAWQDRPYYRERGGSSTNPFMWLMTGSVPLFNVFGIHVRAHASLILTIAVVLIFGLGRGFTLADRVQSMTVLFAIVLLHEFGHCFAARWVGGEANEIVMHPLGGLAMAHPPRRPLPTFITVAGGPMVNVIICLVCGGLLWGLYGWLPWNPFRFQPLEFAHGWLNVWSYTYWVYQISWSLLIFNLLPIFPLDGGQMLQAILWPKFGYYKSMMFSCVTGMVGAVLGGMIALATGNIGLAVLALMGFITCYQMRQQLLAAGPWGFEDEFSYAASFQPEKKGRGKHLSKRAMRKLKKLARKQEVEQKKIDDILAKVSAHGMHSLNWFEKRLLKRATARQREVEVEMMGRGR